MTMQDERNFHCWNYRLWVIETYLDTVGKRASDPEEAKKYQDILLKSEVKLADGIIQGNFSNYSAWHFRGLMMPKLHSQ